MKRQQLTNDYIILTNRPGFVLLDMSQDPEYKSLLDQQKAKTLPKTDPRVRPKASLFQTDEMVHEEVFDEDTGETSIVFKDGIVISEADSDGRMIVPGALEATCRQLLKDLRKIDSTVRLDPMGKLLDEEMSPEERKATKGGRKPKIS